MNLLFGGGSLSSLMKPHYYKKIAPKQILRNWLRQNILWSASRATALQHELVQRSMSQLNEHNHEELDSIYTRPTLDFYLCNKYWKFITGDADISKEQISDLEKARDQLAHYEKLYALMEYGSDLNGILTCLDTRVASNNPSIPQTIYRQSRHNKIDSIFDEVELALSAYYGMIDDCKDFPEWVRKIEEDVGQNMAYTFLVFDESDRDALVGKSELFKRFDLDKQKFFK